MHDFDDDTTLILIPGLRPPVPPRPERLGKRRPAARLARSSDTALAAGFALAAIAVVTAMSVPAGIAVAAFFGGQLVLAFRRPLLEVPNV